ncbi:unnamed protein product [Heterobilharzia americana]|nr:unnamed protein product [Heterobilharzia americana]
MRKKKSAQIQPPVDFYSHQKTSLSKEKTELLSSTITNITDTTTTTTTAAAMVKTPTTNNNHHRRNDAHSSCNSLRTTTNPSITNGVAASRYSIISLKDQRSINSNKYNTFYSIIHSNKPNNYHPHNRNHYPCRKSYMSKRRSIGSQTDFTDIESDNPESYSTLDRYFMQKYKRYPYSIDSNNDNNYNKNSNIRNNSSDYYLFNRTTSTQILPYFRNN